MPCFFGKSENSPLVSIIGCIPIRNPLIRSIVQSLTIVSFFRVCRRKLAVPVTGFFFSLSQNKARRRPELLGVRLKVVKHFSDQRPNLSRVPIRNLLERGFAVFSKITDSRPAEMQQPTL